MQLMRFLPSRTHTKYASNAFYPLTSHSLLISQVTDEGYGKCYLYIILGVDKIIKPQMTHSTSSSSFLSESLNYLQILNTTELSGQPNI